MGAKLLAGVTLAILVTLLAANWTGVRSQQCEPTMFLYGYVFIRTATGENITAPEGLDVYAKRNQDTTVANATVWTEGRYTLSIAGPQNGTQVYIFVENIEVTNVQYQDWIATELNLTVTDSSSPIIEPSSPTPGANLTQQPPLWINASITDDLAVNETSITMKLNETTLTFVYNSTSGELTCKVEQVQTGFLTIDVTSSDLSGNTANEEWNFTLTIPQPPEAEIQSPTTENPTYTNSGKAIQITYNYTDPNPRNVTLAVYDATLTIGQSYIANLNETNTQRNDTVTLNASAPEGKYTVSVTVFNLYNLSRVAQQTEAIIVDNTQPTIGQIAQSPESTKVQPTDTVIVNATITDALSGVLNATLLWRTQDGEWNAVVMSGMTDDLFSAGVPPLEISTMAYYEIGAFDKAGNQAVADNAGQFYTYHVIPEYPAAALFVCLLTSASAFAFLVKRRKIEKTIRSRSVTFK